jgi:UDP-N-acetylglucosamine:LPS N-acetylglucosamine transferase
MAKRQGKLRVCLVASTGGHLTQLLRVEESWKGYETFCITTADVGGGRLEKYGKVHIVGDCNREHPLRAVVVLIRCMKIILCERPDVVISTGAAPGCISCFLAKLIGAKVAWLDSIANTEKLSMSGRIIRPFADLILSQWPDVAQKYNNVAYVGSVI